MKAQHVQYFGMEKIESKDNGRVKGWMKLHDKKGREEAGLFLVEGEHLISEALAAGAVETILTDTVSPFAFEPQIMVSEPIMRKLSASVSGTHLIAVCRFLRIQPQQERRVLLLDGVQDPGNIGTLIRTAVSFSFDAVYCSYESADLYNEKVIRSTQGALFHIPVIRTDLGEQIASLRSDGFEIIATALRDAHPMAEVLPQEKMAFILGNEGSGVSEALQTQSDLCMKIEMNGFESLNVAVAGGIVMYRYRQG